MKKSTLAATVAAMFVTVAGATQASAQTASSGKFFFGFEIGAQPVQREADSETSFPLYDETATISASNPIKNGMVIGFGGGYKLTPSFGVGVSVNIFNAREAEASIVASIPDPVFFNRPKIVTATVGDLQHRETATNISAVYFYPITDTFQVSISGGPTIYNVSHDVPTASVPSGQNLVTGFVTETATGFGGHVGVEGNYMFDPRYGAGIFIRYQGAKVDLPSIQDLTVGGLQVGAGFRVRF